MDKFPKLTQETQPSKRMRHDEEGRSLSPSRGSAVDASIFTRPKPSLSPPRSTDDRKKAKNFFDEIIRFFYPDPVTDKPRAIIVAHVVETLPHYIMALKKIADIVCVIPKGSLTSKADQDRLTEHEKSLDIVFPEEVKQLTKQEKLEFFSDTENGPKNFHKEFNLIDRFMNYERDTEGSLVTTGEQEKFFIIDIGGYFSPCSMALKDRYHDLFIGIIEDTQNGYNRYRRYTREAPNFPLISVARCRLKETEDYNVGKSIVEASDTLSRTGAHTILERMKIIGVLGFGKIGSSIAQHLRQKGVREVIVYDIDPIARLKAASLGFSIVNRTQLLQSSDMIFCATGNKENKALKATDFFVLKDNVFIASCTSHDDEIGKELLEELADAHDENAEQGIEKYRLGNKVVNLLYRGNAVNFAFGAVNGPYIYSVLASILVSISYLPRINKNNFGNIHTFGEEFLDSAKSMNKIAAIWLKHFDNFKEESLFHPFNNKNNLEHLKNPAIYIEVFIQFVKETGEGYEQDENFNNHLWQYPTQPHETGFIDYSDFDEQTRIIYLFLAGHPFGVEVNNILSEKAKELSDRFGINIQMIETNYTCVCQALEQLVEQKLFYIAYFFLYNEKLINRDDANLEQRFLRIRFNVLIELGEYDEAFRQAMLLIRKLQQPEYERLAQQITNTFPSISEHIQLINQLRQAN